ncbi:MAG TPA: glycosyltransferase family A protein [Gemmatimonadales bacterium]|jgi:glycosyltransferase involved in cell wall biosynthesis|nr:glycosyltransferase family A protein [Gemmatimonadales bacterium]
MPPVPTFSVIVPAHNGVTVLPLSLGALAASNLPRERWELIVVDDASGDETPRLAAQWADRVVSLNGAPHGPAYARNRGVEASRGEWVVFIDADVVVHTDTLQRFAEAIAKDPDIDAVFGAYDEAPPAPGFLSRYRNLLHHYIHLCGAGEADTFWAGCGAVRRSAFQRVGGFDEQRYPRPQIEDIELGYRLRDQGSRIVIRPEIQGAHLKRWTLFGSIRTDLLDRGIPWVRLLLERKRMANPAHLNLKRGERAKMTLVWLGLLLLVVALLLHSGVALAAGIAALLTVVLWNLALFRWFGRQRGPLFALAVVPMNLWYYLVSGVAVLAAVTLNLGLGRDPGRTRTRRNRSL